MPKFWTRLVDSLPRESKSLTWRTPLCAMSVVLSVLIFLPFTDTPYAVRVVHDTYDDRGRVEPEARKVISHKVTNRWVWLTSPFHYELEREMAPPRSLGPVGGREVKERTLEVLSRGLSLGLDLRGGTELLYRILHEAGAKGGGVSAEEIKKVVQRRIDAYGLREVRIQAQGADRLLVQLPGQETAALETLKGVIQNIGKLEFRLVASKNFREYEEWQKTGKAPPGWSEYPLRSLKEERYVEEKILVRDRNEMTGENISSTRVITAGGGRTLGPSVGLSFTPAGEREFARVTGENVGERLAIILNTQRSGDQIVEKGTCYSAPVIRTKIYGDAVIEGDFDMKEADALCTVLRAGSLPAPLRLENENSVGASLGSALINKGVVASVIGTVAVILFMTVYYLLPGLIADLTLVLNILMLVAVMILFDATLTLPGIAGLALTVGMAVDANVLIFERIREETSGSTEKPLRLAVREGFDRAFTTILDSNLTTIISAVILLWVGTGPIKGFGLTLTIGLIINIFTAVVVARVVFDILTWRRWVSRLPMLQFFRCPNFRFMSMRWKAIGVSLVLNAIGMVVFISRGAENWDIDFRGGSMMHVVFRHPMDAEALTERLQKLGPEFAQAEVQSLASAAQEGRAILPGRTSTEFEVRVPSLSEVALPNLTPIPGAGPGAFEADFTLAAPMALGELKQKANTVEATFDAVGAPGPDGKQTKFKLAARTIDVDRVHAALEKAVGARLASFQVTKTAPSYAYTAEPQIDRPVVLAEIRRQVRVTYRYALVEPKGQEEGKGEYRSFTIKTTVRDSAAARLGIERAFAALSLQAELLANFKDDLAPEGIQTLSEADGRATVALNLTRPIAPATLEAKLNSWTIEAKVKPAALNSAGEASRLELAMPANKVAEFSQRVVEDPQTFLLSDPVPRVAKVGPAVARELLAWAVVGVVASWLAIIAYVWLRFEKIKYGVAGVLALVHDVLITMGFLAIMGRKFNITVIAALLTIIGYSINDTIVIFDRIRENLRKERKRDVDGRLIDASVNQTLSRSIITSSTVFMAVLALYLFAGGVIQDFTLAMLIGVITGSYSSIFIAAPILILRQQPEKRLAQPATVTA